MPGTVTQLPKPTVRACPVCGNSCLRAAYCLPDFTILTCPDCGHGTTDYTHALSDNQSRFAENRWIETRSMLEQLNRAIAGWRYEDLRRFSPGRDLLEVGCGTSEFLNWAHEAGHRVTGLDLSQHAVRYARERYPELDIRCATLDSASLAAGSFDVVAAFHVLEHVPDPLCLLGQIRRLLREGGLVYIRVPNLNSWYRKVLGRNCWDFSVEHMGHFTYRSLALALQTSGFEVVAGRSGDSDRKHSLWPVLPLLMARGRLMRSLGDALAPPAGPGRAAGRGDARRIARKRTLLRAYMSYRRAATVLIRPFSSLQVRRGGGVELVAVARKRAGSPRVPGTLSG